MLLIFGIILQQMADSEVLVIIIARHELDISIIPTFNFILPMISNLLPMRLFTSLNRQITVTNQQHSLYHQLVRHMEEEEGQCDMTATLHTVVKAMDRAGTKQYRVCLVGNQVADWGVVMELKRRGVVVDIAGFGQVPLQIQIAYITGGIYRLIKTQIQMIKAFQCDFILSTGSRVFYKLAKKETVLFSLNCSLCEDKEGLSKQLLVCSVCLAVYCQNHSKQKECVRCGETLDQ